MRGVDNQDCAEICNGPQEYSNDTPVFYSPIRQGCVPAASIGGVQRLLRYCVIKGRGNTGTRTELRQLNIPEPNRHLNRFCGGLRALFGHGRTTPLSADSSRLTIRRAGMSDWHSAADSKSADSSRVLGDADAPSTPGPSNTSSPGALPRLR